MSLAVGQEIGGRVTRTYTIAVPDEPASDVLPAIIVFHGGGGDATVVAKRWGVDPSEPVPDDLAGYRLVFPESDPRLGTRWIHLDSDDVGFPTLDLEFIGHLVDELAAPQSIPTTSTRVARVSADPDLLFVAGFSNGAGMVWQLLYSALESRFQGFVAVGKALDPEKVKRHRARLARSGAVPAPAPVAYIQGTADPGYRAPFTQRESEIGVTLPAFTLHEMLDRHGICGGGPADTTLVPGSPGVTEVVLQHFEGNEAFLLGAVINGGHNWPTPSTRGNPPVADHFDATATIVEFWRRHAGLP